MNRFLIACLGFLLLFPIAVATQSCSYVGVGGGTSTWDVEFSGFPQVDDADTSIKLFGGFDLGETFAIELAYADLGEASGSLSFPGIVEATITLEATAISAALVGQLPLGETFALFGKAGMAFWDAELTSESTIFGIPQPTQSVSDTGVDPLVGFGLGIMPGETFGFRLEFERYLELAELADVDVLSASVLFRF